MNANVISFRMRPKHTPKATDTVGGKAEYATANNFKIDARINSRTASAINVCCAAWSPTMEDAVLTGQATRRNYKGESVPVIHRCAIHRSHGGFYDRNRAAPVPMKGISTRSRIEPLQSEINEADVWASEQEKSACFVSR